MWAIIRDIFNYVPKYLLTFVRCLTRPINFSLELPNVRNLERKRSKKKREKDIEKALHEALSFLLVSMIITTIIRVLSIDEKTTWNLAIGSAIASFVSVFLVATALRLAWLCVGGKFRFWDYFVLDCYYLGVVSVILGLFVLIVISTTNLHLIVSDAVAALILIVLILSFWFYWSINVWEVYARVNSLSRRRTLIAYVLIHVFAVPTLIVVHALEVRLQNITYFGFLSGLLS